MEYLYIITHYPLAPGSMLHKIEFKQLMTMQRIIVSGFVPIGNKHKIVLAKRRYLLQNSVLIGLSHIKKVLLGVADRREWICLTTGKQTVADDGVSSATAGETIASLS